jgi:ribosomal-protein-alanine N-acetyltransferase
MQQIPLIETPQLLLRDWWYEDIAPLAAIYADPEVERQLVPMSRDATEEQVAYLLAHWEVEGFGLWAVEHRETGRFIGRIGLIRHTDFTQEPDPVEVGWTLERAVWGQGLATEGAMASLRFGFDTLGCDRIISITRPTNTASRRVMEKCGLTYQGATFWREIDHVWYAIDRDRWKAAGSGSP